MENEFDFIVIGGGICGLQIGALCSTLGKVLLIEKTGNIGGRARVVEKNGFLLDWGPHPIRFGPNSSIALTLKDVGIKTAQFINPGLTYAYMKDGTRHIFPSGVKGFLKTKMISLPKFGGVLLKINRDLKKNPQKILNMSFSQAIQEYKIDPQTQKALLIGSASMQVNPFPERSSIGEFIYNLLQVLKKKSVFYPKGGWNYFFDNLSLVIEKNGGTIQLNKKVDRIIVENGNALGIEMSGNIIKGKNIISTIPIQQIFEILDPSLIPENIVEKCKNQRQTAGIVIDFCLSKPITDETLVFFEEPPSFGMCPSNMSPEVAPIGKSLMTFFAPTEISIIKNKEQREQFHKKFRDIILKTYPELEKLIEYERPLFLDMVDGIEIAIDQNRINRVKPEDIKIKNLFLTGDSIGGEGAGGDIGHTSVRECFELIKKTIE